MQDADCLYKTGDEGRLLAMNIRKLENGYSLQSNPLLIQGIVRTLGTKNAKASPHTRNHQRQSTGRRRGITNDGRSTNLRDVCWQSNVHQSSSSTRSAQREHTHQISEESGRQVQCEGSRSVPGNCLARVKCKQELCPDPHAKKSESAS